ncbi:MAG: NAD(P)H-hydrate epimerase [Nitrosopumilus sp.]|nr:NAD(P)H-hydrate epimerase [Nitrosopumilus sp.]CAI9831018.1 NAD(P)H-hydrate epimerase [Nitrosopumilaceae archaeon]MDA7941692.1 NAD(P)H-hydrate epimerase [Nitrosopumilus sp.]MDA7944012.1 NAD(P)H-hydrate epimerase [Nitrosopumilus sp.]MDA7945732.1 NAD(P)H-hydrate epimerase [Nitrosopumilus sp.]
MAITVEQMYRIEEKGHAMGFLKKFMMENAGAAATRRLAARTDLASKRVLVLAGLGNNGGDGMVMARHMAGRGADVTVCLMGDPGDIRTEESSWNWSILEKMPSVRRIRWGDDAGDPDIIIDAMLGTGISGDVREPYSSAIRYVNSARSLKVAVDVPTGLDPGTGAVSAAHTSCDMTVTFHRTKEGIPSRPDLTGDLYEEPIGIPPEAEEGIL